MLLAGHSGHWGSVCNPACPPPRPRPSATLALGIAVCRGGFVGSLWLETAGSWPRGKARVLGSAWLSLVHNSRWEPPSAPRRHPVNTPSTPAKKGSGKCCSDTHSAIRHSGQTSNAPPRQGPQSYSVQFLRIRGHCSRCSSVFPSDLLRPAAA